MSRRRCIFVCAFRSICRRLYDSLSVLCYFFLLLFLFFFFFFFFQAEDGIRDWSVTGVQTCALPIFAVPRPRRVLERRGRGTATLLAWSRRSVASVVRSFFSTEALRAPVVATGDRKSVV